MFTLKVAGTAALVALSSASNLRTSVRTAVTSNAYTVDNDVTTVHLKVPIVYGGKLDNYNENQLSSSTSSLLQLTPSGTKELKEHVDSIKQISSPTTPLTPPIKSRSDLYNKKVSTELNDLLSRHATTKYPGVTTPKPRVVRMCSRGDKSNVKVHVDTEGVATEGFQVQAVVTDTATGQVAPLAAMTIVPSMPFWLGMSPQMKEGAAKGGAAAASREGKATQDIILKASPGSTLLGPAEYQLHLQIVSPDPEAIPSDFTGKMVGERKYNYGRMQQLLDEVGYVPIQIEDCGGEDSKEKKETADRPAAITMTAELQHTEADSYFKLTDVDDAAKSAFARLAGDYIEKDQVADFRLENGDRPGRTKLSLRIIFSNRKLAHLASIEMMKEKAKWEDILYNTMKTALTSIGVSSTLNESPIRHFIIAEQPYEKDEKSKIVCCQARTATCMACSRGISIESFCSLEPSTPGCTSKPSGEDTTTNTVEQYLVDVILNVHKPSHSLGIFEGTTNVPKELQASMQASMSVLNYADPDMSVRAVQVESASNGKEKVPLVHITLATSSQANAEKLSKILSESSTVQKDFMGKSLTDAFHATKQLSNDDRLQVDNIQATPVVQPVPDSVNAQWDKIAQRAKFNKEGDITWDEIMESTGGQPPLSKSDFDNYCAGEKSLSAAGLIMLREKQAVTV